MVNKYLLALLLTSVLVFVGFSFTRWTDEQRLMEFKNAFDESALDSQSIEHLLLYEAIFSDKENVCPAIRTGIESQIARTRSVLSELEVAQKQNVFSNFEIVKKKYHNQNIQLYLLVQKAINDCGYSDIEPVVFFYSDKDNCPDCIAEGKTLDSLAVSCPNIRVFAFPYDLGIPVVDVLKVKYGVTKAPAVVIKGERYDGAVSGQYLLSSSKLNCNGKD